MKKCIALMLAVCCALTAAFPAYARQDNTTTNTSNLAGTYNITMWVSEMQGVAALFRQQIEAFEAANPGIVINAAIEGVSEADAGSKVVADVASAPDMFCFAQDQLDRLVMAAALAAPGKEASESIIAANDAGAVAAASIAGTLYAYPMTSDNGYYLYYDTSIISPAEAESLEAIIAACEANGVKFRYALENAWYTPSFFFATGCHSEWFMNENGEFTAIDDNFNSPEGLIAMKGMRKLAQSPCYDSNADIFTGAGAIVTGIWNANAAAEHFGRNLGATDLPSFKVDGQSYHLGSFGGHKLMGIKPQADPRKAAVLSLLAQYLTGEECQMQRYQQFQWGPSNRNVQASPAVQSNISLAALLKQSEYSTPQGQIHGSWWDITKVLGADAKAAQSDADLQTALDNYKNTIDGLFSMNEEARNAWSIIGNICGTSWDTDFPMTEISPGVYLSDVLELNAGEEFKVRQGASWDMNFGVEFNGANIVVEEDGLYQVQFVWYGGTEGTVSLIREGDPSDEILWPSGTCGENLTWTFASGVLTISGTGKMDDYTFSAAPWQRYQIQSVVIESGVTSIGDNAFFDCYKLTNLTIPEGVTSIGDNAFSFCSALTDITIPEGVTSIGNYAFNCCTSLTSVTIPESIISIGSYAFHNCHNLFSVSIPAGVTQIRDFAFTACSKIAYFSVAEGNRHFCSDENGVLFDISKTKLLYYPAGNSNTSYSIPETVTEIGVYAFEGCQHLNFVSIPEGVALIDDYAFYNCRNLTSVSLPASVSSISNLAYAYCDRIEYFSVADGNLCFRTDEDGALFDISMTKLLYYPAGNGKSAYKIPKTVTSIEPYAFCACADLTSVSIPDSVTYIGNNAFSYCSSLTYIALPNGIAQIENSTFRDCYSLTSIYIPDSVGYIGWDAFWECYMLTDVYYGGTETEWYWIEIDVWNDCLSSATIHYNSLSTKPGSLVPDANGNFWYCENDQIRYDFTGLVAYTDGNRYYVENGRVNFDYVGLIYFNDTFYYITTGVVNTGFTGLAEFFGSWYYVEQSMLNLSYTGLVYHGGTFFYVENGVLNTGFTGLVEFFGNWYYVENGVLNFGYSGLVYLNGVFYLVSAGILNTGYTGLVDFLGSWYYVERGVLNFGYSGLTYHGGFWFYVENGVLNTGFTGLTLFLDHWFYVESGVLNNGFTGLTYFNDTFFYIQNGVLDVSYVGLVEFYGAYYYVSGGIIDFSYSGPAYAPDGTLYDVIGGVAYP